MALRNVGQLLGISDATLQRALNALRDPLDSAITTLNKAFNFTDSAIVALKPLSSLTGFKTVIGPWQTGLATATTDTRLPWGQDGANLPASNPVNAGFVAQFPGSILGIAFTGAGSPNGTITLTVYKNSVATAATVTLVHAAGGRQLSGTFPKGAATFAVNDELALYYRVSAATTGRFVANFTIEMGA